MQITANLTDASVLQELGARLARQRLESGLTQAALAREAGVAKRTLERIEAGHSAEFASLIRILRALKLIDGLEAFVPDKQPGPMALLQLQGRVRQRVRPTHAAHSLKNRKSSSSSTITGTTKKSSRWTWNE